MTDYTTGPVGWTRKDVVGPSSRDSHPREGVDSDFHIPPFVSLRIGCRRSSEGDGRDSTSAEWTQWDNQECRLNSW